MFFTCTKTCTNATSIDIRESILSVSFPPGRPMVPILHLIPCSVCLEVMCVCGLCPLCRPYSNSSHAVSALLSVVYVACSLLPPVVAWTHGYSAWHMVSMSTTRSLLVFSGRYRTEIDWCVQFMSKFRAFGKNWFPGTQEELCFPKQTVITK